MYLTPPLYQVGNSGLPVFKTLRVTDGDLYHLFPPDFSMFFSILPPLNRTLVLCYNSGRTAEKEKEGMIRG